MKAVRVSERPLQCPGASRARHVARAPCCHTAPLSIGDKMTPLSETTILVPKLVGRGLTTGQHIRNMFWTAGPAIGVSLLFFLVLGLTAEPKGGVSTQAALDTLEGEFNISVLSLLP